MEDRGKKIKCIDNKTVITEEERLRPIPGKRYIRIVMEEKLTLGKIYTVLDSNKYGYKIRDDNNLRRFYDKTRFEMESP